ncbi:PEP/pyruvate-binding domain-containing protein [Haliangium sp.]|uniref:PEP/pyruvate-binding domain-containing protein n=1 Tax=Haliangium sp. TaxID=2663208 RepID=UPI003D0E1EE5
MPSSQLTYRAPWHRRHQDLMPHLVREILLVSSDYDAFVLEEDGPLTEQLVSGYSELSLVSIPRISHARSAGEALEMLADRRFDLVITVARVRDARADEISRSVRARQPHVHVVLLLFDEADLDHFAGEVLPDTIDLAVLWSGDAGSLIAAIKLVEDHANVAHDTRSANVDVILVVEDNVRAYSSSLAVLYPELFRQSNAMLQEASNIRHRVLRMRARPKILLAQTYEEAAKCARAYGPNLLALVSDLRYPRGGREDSEAGLRLVAEVRAQLPELPVLLVSSETELATYAAELDVWHVGKGADTFPSELRRFLAEAVGFGDFVFRLRDGSVLEHARNVYELEQVLGHVPAESVAHHSHRHDFSIWLRARGMLELAAEIRPLRLSDYDSVEAARAHMIEILRQARERGQEGIISDVDAPPTASETRFVRIGRGSIGGKGRGIAFARSLIVSHGLADHFPALPIRIPRTVALGTEAYDRFLARNAEYLRFDLEPDGPERGDDAVDRWLQAEFDPELAYELELAFQGLHGPLAVRSSSLLEDSRFQAFAGVYDTYMLPNNHPDAKVRFRHLMSAIKAVYASVFSKNAKSYIAATPHVLEEQLMAIVIQQVVGKPYGGRFYPLISGTAQSHNHYPVGSQRAHEGIATVALGLGETVAGGGTTLRFSPGCPRVLPQFPDARSFMRYSQTKFYAVDLWRDDFDPSAGARASLVTCDLGEAEADGTLHAVASVYSPENEVLRDNLDLRGPRVLTFNNVLKWESFPLAKALAVVLDLFRNAIGGEVEIEFAVHAPRRGDRPARLYILQVRPMPPQLRLGASVDLDEVAPEQVLLRPDGVLGHGIEEVSDVVYVKRSDLGFRDTPTCAVEVRRLTAPLHERGRPYLLIGPGRWGTSDSALGIPVSWRDIAGARVIVEVPLAGRYVEPSQGSHFFHNLTAMRIGYLTVERRPEAALDRLWLDALPAAAETNMVRHVELDAPLVIQMDSLSNRAVVLKPAKS